MLVQMTAMICLVYVSVPTVSDIQIMEGSLDKITSRSLKNELTLESFLQSMVIEMG